VGRGSLTALLAFGGHAGVGVNVDRESVEFSGLFSDETELPGDMPRSPILDVNHGDDAVKTNFAEAMGEDNPRGFSRQPLLPAVLGQPPANFNFTGFAPGLQAAETDQSGIVFSLKCPQAIFVQPPESHLAIDELLNPFVCPRYPTRNIPYDLGVGCDRLEASEVIPRPAVEVKSFCFEERLAHGISFGFLAQGDLKNFR